MTKLLASLSILALAAPALADELAAPPQALEAAAVVETAQLDPVAIQSGAAVEAVTPSSSITLGLVFGVVTMTVYVASTDSTGTEAIVPPASH